MYPTKDECGTILRVRSGCRVCETVGYSNQAWVASQPRRGFLSIARSWYVSDYRGVRVYNPGNLTVYAHAVTCMLKYGLWLGISNWGREFALFRLAHTLVSKLVPNVERDSDKPQSNALRPTMTFWKRFGGKALGKGPSKHTTWPPSSA